jgi:putative hydrolase of the HAD superfamily
MSVRLVSFDAADTLVAVNWSPGQFAVDRASEIGIELDRQTAAEVYERLLYSRWREYQELNKCQDGSSNEERCDAFWLGLTSDWLGRLGLPDRGPELLAHAAERMYAADSPVYSLFDDVLDCLAAIKAKGIPMVVLSNWDYSLHRVLRAYGLTSWFAHVFASLEFGPEKPEPELFHFVEGRTGFRGAEVLHIGDNPVDDLHGALNAGWRAALIDRTLPARDGHRLSSLSQVVDLL